MVIKCQVRLNLLICLIILTKLLLLNKGKDEIFNTWLLFAGWNGYCELLTRNYKPFELAQIMYLPIIDAPPSDYDTIYTSLKVAVEKSAAAG